MLYQLFTLLLCGVCDVFLKTRCDVQFLWGRFLFHQYVSNGLTEPPLSQGHTHREPWLWYIPRPQGILSNPKDDLNLHWSHDWNKPVWLVWARQDKIYQNMVLPPPFLRLDMLKYDSIEIVKLMWCCFWQTIQTPRFCAPWTSALCF